MRRSAAKALRRLSSACEALCEALARATPERRREVIERCSQGLRSELISVKEVRKGLEKQAFKCGRRSESARRGARRGGVLALEA